MISHFWIMVITAVIACGILFWIDYNKDRAAKKTLIAGFVALLALLIFAAWGFNAIPVIVWKCAAIVGGAYFGMYLIRQISNRKF